MKIALDAAEFIDRIEEQLSWIAVAGSCANEYDDHQQRIEKGAWFFTEHFRCAAPWVSLGGDESAILGFDDGAEAVTGVLPNLDAPRAKLGKVLGQFLSELRRPLCRATVREGKAFRGHDPNTYLLQSRAILSARHDLKRGPARGMRRVWCQTIELNSGRPPSHESVLVDDYVLRPDGREVLSGVTARPVSEALLGELMMDAADQIESEQQWTVELSMSKERTGLGIHTDAVGARDLVNSLGRESGRKVLVHWVRDHYRRRRGGGDPSLVRAHLRGTQFAVTKHMYATIWPSVVDIDRACNGGRFDRVVSP